MTDNLAIWSALEKTDPAHTKGFKRAGGFSGTATKPIYNIKRMTEQFGPCGIGWGMTVPAFETVAAGDEIMVFCTAGLWHGTRENLIYGVGGDKVSAKRNSGDNFNSDEAFKAAYTDAISNAMKMLGMGADIHMGRFDDDKYVRDLKDEFRENAKPDHEGYVANASTWMRDQTDAAAVNQAWSAEQDNYHKLPVELQKKLIGVRDEVLAKLTGTKPAAVPDEWQILADDIKRDIDDALDTAAVRDIIEGKRLADLTRHSKKAGDFLRNRADLRIGTMMQGRKAA